MSLFLREQIEAELISHLMVAFVEAECAYRTFENNNSRTPKPPHYERWTMRVKRVAKFLAEYAREHQSYSNRVMFALLMKSFVPLGLAMVRDHARYPMAGDRSWSGEQVEQCIAVCQEVAQVCVKEFSNEADVADAIGRLDGALDQRFVYSGFGGVVDW